MENNNLWCWCCKKTSRAKKKQKDFDGIEFITIYFDDTRFNDFVKIMKKKNNDIKEFFILLTYGGTFAFGIWVGTYIITKLFA
jgi:hypothetical protein